MKTKMSIQIAVNINGGELIYDGEESICLSLKEAWGYATDYFYQWGCELISSVILTIIFFKISFTFPIQESRLSTDIDYSLYTDLDYNISYTFPTQFSIVLL